MGKATAIFVTNQFLKAVRKKRDQFIQFPVQFDDAKKNIEDFKCPSKFPNVVGAIDGTHIEICAPKQNVHDYFNRNHYYIIVLHGIVDVNQKFLHVTTGFPGSMHDSRILRWTEVYDLAFDEEILAVPLMKLNNATPIRPLLLGDPAYALSNWLMKPYPLANISRRQKNLIGI